MMLTYIRGNTAGALPAATQGRLTKAAAQGRQAGTQRVISHLCRHAEPAAGTESKLISVCLTFPTQRVEWH